MDEDERLYKCFLYTLKKKAKKLDLPMEIGQFFIAIMASW